MVAALDGSTEATKGLLDNDADVNATEKHGATPLRITVQRGHVCRRNETVIARLWRRTELCRQQYDYADVCSDTEKQNCRVETSASPQC